MSILYDTSYFVKPGGSNIHKISVDENTRIKITFILLYQKNILLLSIQDKSSDQQLRYKYMMSKQIETSNHIPDSS